MTVYGNLVTLPKNIKLALLPELDFEFKYDVPNGISGAAGAYINVYDKTGKDFLLKINGLKSNDTFVFSAPYNSMEYIEHGAKYRLYITDGGGKKYMPVYGRLTWTGR